MGHLVVSINLTDLSGLSPVLAGVLILLAVVGIAALAFIAFVFGSDFFERFEPDLFGVEPVDRGTALPCWYNDDSLKSVAKQHGLHGIPVKIERKRGAGIKIPFLVGSGKAEGSTTETEAPYEDRGQLILQLLAQLDKKGVLNRTADCIPVDDIHVDLIVAFRGERANAEAYFEDWLEKKFPDGLESVSTGELATKLAGISDELPEEQIRQRLCEIHRSIAEGDGRVEFLEGEWRVVEEEDGSLVLERTTLRVDPYDLTPRRNGSASIPMPDGASIRVRLDGELTRHGRNAMVGVTRPIRACVAGTVRQHDPHSGCLEITPIAVFQRLGSA